MNGGVDLTSSGGALPFDNTLAVLRQDSTYEKVTRNDVDIALIGTLLGDTSDVMSITFYYSHTLREFREREDPYHVFPPGVSSDHVSSWMGVQASQDVVSRFQRFSAGASAELRQIEGSPDLGRRRDLIGSLRAKEELEAAPAVALALYGRLDRYIRKNYAGLGADCSVRLGPWLSFFGGASMSWRVPNYQELYWSDSTVVRTGSIVAEHHAVAEAGAELGDARTGTVRVALFRRTVTDPIVYSPHGGTRSPFPGAVIANGPAINSGGVNAHIDLRLFSFLLEGNVEYIVQTSGGGTLQAFPKFSGNGGLYYRSALAGGKLELKTGFRGRFTSPYAGVLFNPEMIAAVSNSGTPLGTSASADFFLLAHIGDAYIHFMWENLANIHYYGTPYYPGGERGIRFGISWEFLN